MAVIILPYILIRFKRLSDFKNSYLVFKSTRTGRRKKKHSIRRQLAVLFVIKCRTLEFFERRDRGEIKRPLMYSCFDYIYERFLYDTKVEGI